MTFASIVQSIRKNPLMWAADLAAGLILTICLAAGLTIDHWLPLVASIMDGK